MKSLVQDSLYYSEQKGVIAEAACAVILKMPLCLQLS